MASEVRVASAGRYRGWLLDGLLDDRWRVRWMVCWMVCEMVCWMVIRCNNLPKSTSQRTPLILPLDKRKGPVSHVLNGITDSWDMCMFEFRLGEESDVGGFVRTCMTWLEQGLGSEE